MTCGVVLISSRDQISPSGINATHSICQNVRQIQSTHRLDVGNDSMEMTPLIHVLMQQRHLISPLMRHLNKFHPDKASFRIRFLISSFIYLFYFIFFFGAQVQQFLWLLCFRLSDWRWRWMLNFCHQAERLRRPSPSGRAKIMTLSFSHTLIRSTSEADRIDARVSAATSYHVQIYSGA